MVHQCSVEEQAWFQIICKSFLSILGFAIHTVTNLTLLSVWKMKRLHLDKGPEQ